MGLTSKGRHGKGRRGRGRQGKEEREEEGGVRKEGKGSVYL